MVERPLWVRSPARMRARVRQWRARGQRVGFVPTMGYLHAGHLALLLRARKDAPRVVASVFVNPLQFGPGEDFATYPRDRARDRRLLGEAGVDLVFAPEARHFLPEDQAARVSVPELDGILEGRARPGHFTGVATIVTKLLHAVEPDVLWLGQKDAQQVAVLRRMIEDLGFPVEVRVGPTVRDPDGLALSSRNARLSPAERAQARLLHLALRAGRARLRAGAPGPASVERAMQRVLAEATLGRVDYARLVDARTFDTPRRLEGPLVLAVAVRFPS